MAKSRPKQVKLERAPRLVDQATEFLTNQIKSEAYAEGDKLPSESTLSERLGVSRTVVREALSRLIYDGVLEPRQGVGIIVAGSSSKRTFRIEPVENRKSPDSKYLLELRAILEGEAASLAAIRRDADHIAQLDHCLKEIKIHTHSTEESIREDMKFHELIAEASCNPYLLDFMIFVRNHLKFLLIKTHGIHRDSTQWTYNAHNQIFQAIVRRDSQGAREAAIHHIKVAASGLNLTLFD